MDLINDAPIVSLNGNEFMGVECKSLNYCKGTTKIPFRQEFTRKDVDGNEDNNSIDTTNENKQYNKNRNMKQTIKLSESELKRVIVESVKRVLKESGNTKRGSYLMGRAGKRNLIRGDISNFIDKRDKASNKDAFNQGMEDQTAYGINLKDPSRDSTWDMQNNRRLKFNYNTYKTEDMDELGRKFIDFIEKYDGGALMDTVVDYESGNQTGKKESPLKEIIPYFEEKVLGYDCTPDMIDAIRRAYNQWWFYAEDQLMPYDEDEEDVHESINRKINRIVSESIRRNLR